MRRKTVSDESASHLLDLYVDLRHQVDRALLLHTQVAFATGPRYNGGRKQAPHKTEE